jgi:hypothetical protein
MASGGLGLTQAGEAVQFRVCLNGTTAMRAVIIHPVAHLQPPPWRTGAMRAHD